MYIQTEETPNPNALKFLPGEQVMPQGTIYVDHVEDAARSPLAEVLFKIGHVEAVFLGADFITVTKASEAKWEILKPIILTEVMDFYIQGKSVLPSAESKASAAPKKIDYDKDDPLIVQIIELIETRVRPAVAQDGGDIIFQNFDKETGVVTLELHGACSGCPSSTATLKDGIENMLKHYVPEITSVEAVA
jgi:Fe-S cluster biogenesis protein NfuA